MTSSLFFCRCMNTAFTLLVLHELIVHKKSKLQWIGGCIYAVIAVIAIWGPRE